MMAHILDCMISLGNIHQYRPQAGMGTGELGIPSCGEVQRAHNKVFQAAVATAMQRLIVIEDDSEDSTVYYSTDQSLAVEKLAEAFSDPTSRSDPRSWLPLHWAVALASSPPPVIEPVTIEDVKVIYGMDARALQTPHVKFESAPDPAHNGASGLTAAQMLCATPDPSMPLVRLFSVCNPNAFVTNDSTPAAAEADNDEPAAGRAVGALHAACIYGTPTVELVRHLLQLDSSQTAVRGDFTGHIGDHNHTPLGYLCTRCLERDDGLFDGVVQCLLDVDSTAGVVADALMTVLHSYLTKDSPKARPLLKMVEMLLAANPAAAVRCDHEGRSLVALVLHHHYNACALSISLLQLILTHHKDLLNQADNKGHLPAHVVVAHSSSVELIDFVLGLYPTPHTVTAPTADNGQNLLHLAITARTFNFDVVKMLCTRYPAMLHQTDANGFSPSTLCLKDFQPYLWPVFEYLCATGGPSLLRTPLVHPTDETFSRNGWLPLHFFVSCYSDRARDEHEGQLRHLLAAYPEAASIEGGV